MAIKRAQSHSDGHPECGGKVVDLSFSPNHNIGVKKHLPENPRGEWVSERMGACLSAMDGVDREGRRG